MTDNAARDAQYALRRYEGGDARSRIVASTLIDSPTAQRAALARIGALTRVPGVTARSGPYPVTFTSLAVNGRTENASLLAEGRDQAPAAVDQPQVTAFFGCGRLIMGMFRWRYGR